MLVQSGFARANLARSNLAWASLAALELVCAAKSPSVIPVLDYDLRYDPERFEHARSNTNSSTKTAPDLDSLGLWFMRFCLASHNQQVAHFEPPP